MEMVPWEYEQQSISGNGQYNISIYDLVPINNDNDNDGEMHGMVIIDHG